MEITPPSYYTDCILTEPIELQLEADQPIEDWIFVTEVSGAKIIQIDPLA